MRKLSVLSIVLGVLVAVLSITVVATLKRNSVLTSQLGQHQAGGAPAAAAVQLPLSTAATPAAAAASVAPVTSSSQHRTLLAPVRTTSPATRKVLSATPKPAGLPPFNSGGLMMGTAKPNFPAGTANTVAVVYTAPIPKGGAVGTVDIPIALRNNTPGAVSSIEVSATIRDSTGAIIASGSNLGTQPEQLAPGEVGLADLLVDTGGKELPADATFTYTAQTGPPGTATLDGATVKVVEVNRVGTNIVGSARNTTGQTVSGPLEAAVWCFDRAGHLTAEAPGLTAGTQSIAPQSTATFTVDLGLLQLDTPATACDTYTVGVTGYFS